MNSLEASRRYIPFLTYSIYYEIIVIVTLHNVKTSFILSSPIDGDSTKTGQDHLDAILSCVFLKKGFSDAKKTCRRNLKLGKKQETRNVGTGSRAGAYNPIILSRRNAIWQRRTGEFDRKVSRYENAGGTYKNSGICAKLFEIRRDRTS
jgi:hypothetical protein